MNTDPSNSTGMSIVYPELVNDYLQQLTTVPRASTDTYIYIICYRNGKQGHHFNTATYMTKPGAGLNESISEYVTDLELINLHALLGDILFRALDIIDTREITQYSFNSTSIFVVVAERSVRYKVLPSVNYCSCPAFKFRVLQSSQEYFCKHVLACRLARIIGRFKAEACEDSFVSILNDLVENVTTTG